LGFKLAKIAVYAFAAWFVWVSWRAAPHFSDGIKPGLAFYREEFGQVLDEFASAGSSAARAMKLRVEAMNLFAGPEPEARPFKGRYRTLGE
jgi:hypothetical protein